MATSLALLSPISIRTSTSTCSGGSPCLPAAGCLDLTGVTPSVATQRPSVSPAAVLLSPGPKAPVPQLSPITSAKRRHRTIQSVFDFKRAKTEASETSSDSIVTSSTDEVKYEQPSLPDGIRPTGKRQQTLSEYVLACLANYGLCVLDNFMGKVKASQILQDVQKLDECGVLKSGKTVQKEDQVKNVRKVRQDRIAFVLRNKSHCIDDLVRKLDNLLTHVQIKSKQDPKLGGGKFVDFSGRTRAMVSCYPGNGTYYERHVDNHNKDGRCVTVVYYLNKVWNTEVDGGLLKVYPKQVSPRIAKIEPIFDRVLIFWSDDRNPHEVLPAFRNRYAITLWYFDKDEREKALAQHRGLGDCDTGRNVLA